MIWIHNLVALMECLGLDLTCKLSGKHKPGERLGKTVWRCSRCQKLYQPPRLFLVRVERTGGRFWKEAA